MEHRDTSFLLPTRNSSVLELFPRGSRQSETMFLLIILSRRLRLLVISWYELLLLSLCAASRIWVRHRSVVTPCDPLLTVSILQDTLPPQKCFLSRGGNVCVSWLHDSIIHLLGPDPKLFLIATWIKHERFHLSHRNSTTSIRMEMLLESRIQIQATNVIPKLNFVARLLQVVFFPNH